MFGTSVGKRRGSEINVGKIRGSERRVPLGRHQKNPYIKSLIKLMLKKESIV
jgi:hypothetical protein